MKSRGIVFLGGLLAIVGVACDSQPAPPPSAAPDVATAVDAESAHCDFSAYRPIEGSFDPAVRVLSKPNPAYPEEARIKGIGGGVALRVLVDASGAVTKACAIDGPPLLRGAAERAALGFRFAPVLMNGKPVPYVVHKVTIQYDPRERPGAGK